MAFPNAGASKIAEFILEDMNLKHDVPCVIIKDVSSVKYLWLIR